MERRPIDRSTVRQIAVGLTIVSAVSTTVLPILLLGPWPLTWGALGVGFVTGLGIGPGAAIGALITRAVQWKQDGQADQQKARVATVAAILVPQAAFFAWFFW